MKKLRIDLGQFLLALDSSSEMENFLDRTTGEIVLRWEEDPGVGEIDARLAAGPDGRYELIDPWPSRERFEVMVDFAESLPESALKERLFHALEQRKPFRGFKDALFDDETVRQRWFAFERAAGTREAERRLASLGIEFVWTDAAAEKMDPS